MAIQTDPNIFFHCRPVDGATVMATKLVVDYRGRRVACWTFTGRVFHPAQRRPLNGHPPSSILIPLQHFVYCLSTSVPDRAFFSWLFQFGDLMALLQ